MRLKKMTILVLVFLLGTLAGNLSAQQAAPADGNATKLTEEQKLKLEELRQQQEKLRRQYERNSGK